MIACCYVGFLFCSREVMCMPKTLRNDNTPKADDDDVEICLTLCVYAVYSKMMNRLYYGWGIDVTKPLAHLA